MAALVRVLVACGSGVATSTMAQEEIKKILDGAGINAKIYKATINEIEGKQDDVDLILVTTNYKLPLRKPCLSVFGLISGINKEKISQDIITVCKGIIDN